MKSNIQAFCPMCFTAHGHHFRKSQRVGYLRMGEPENFWERIERDYDLSHPFGVEFGTGRGGLKDTENFSADDPRAEPYRSPMGKVLLLALARGLRFGLVQHRDVTHVLEHWRKGKIGEILPSEATATENA